MPVSDDIEFDFPLEILVAWCYLMTRQRPLPSYDLALIKRLAADRGTFQIEKRAYDDALGFGLDHEDVIEAIQELKLSDFVKTEPTRYSYPKTYSDYYIAYLDVCLTRIFIKLLVYRGVLVLTSFKEDDRYGS